MDIWAIILGLLCGVLLFCIYKTGYHKGYIDGFEKCDSIDEGYFKELEKLNDDLMASLEKKSKEFDDIAKNCDPNFLIKD